MITQLKRIITDCGNTLLSLNESEKAKGEWQADQFKAMADNTAHEFLIKALKKEFDLPIISEEDPSLFGLKENDYIIIDPIDGTASFSHGYKGWVTQAAVIVNQKPIVSVIFAPALNELYWAEKGQGAFLNDLRLRIYDAQTSTIDSIIDNYPEARGITKEVVDHFQIKNYVESGSIGLKICKIASGKSDLFFKAMKPKDWDLAAPELILEEAGGYLTDANGKKFVYGSQRREHEGLIASRSQDITNKVSDWYKTKNLG